MSRKSLETEFRGSGHARRERDGAVPGIAREERGTAVSLEAGMRFPQRRDAVRITVVVPTYNEAANLPALVQGLCSLPLDLRVLVVDDDSPDGTGAVAERLAAERPGRVGVLHRPGKLGLRAAYLSGFARAIEEGAEAIGQMDADLSHDPAELPAMASALGNADVVLGSRYVPGGSVDPRWPRWRRWLSAFGNAYARTILELPLRDATTGFRLWRREALSRLPLERVGADGYGFLVEMCYIAHLLGLRFASVPIHFTERRRGDSKMSLKIQLEAAVRVWKVRWDCRDLGRTRSRRTS